jgi:hypothetical protein
VAGYDFFVKVGTPTEDALLRPLLHGLQLRARQRWVTIHYRRRGDEYYVTVDGPLTNMQSSRGPIASALGGIADAADVPLSRRRRLQIGRRVLRGYVRGAWDATISVLELAHDLGGVPSSFIFDSVADRVIEYRLDGLTSALEAWQNEEAPTEQALEELHAVAELSMGFLLGEAWDDRSFAEQVGEMVRRGWMSSEHQAALLELKDRRRSIRHHRGQMPRDELWERLPAVLAALHSIVDRFA